MKKLLIFDFDGTIADTKSLYYKAIFEKLKFFGYSYNDIDRAIDLGLSLRETLRKMGFSFLVSWVIRKSIMQKAKKSAEKVKKCRNVDSIKEIKAQKILVSNSLKEFIIPILKRFGLNKEFKEIYGADDFSIKADFIKKYLKKNKIRKNSCYYIGDRAADVKTAKRAGCRSVIIAGKCAWNSPKEILREEPDFIIEDIKDINKIIHKL